MKIFQNTTLKQQHLGLFQAQPGNESNLLVIRKNGSIFSYVIKYKKELEQLNHFIAKRASIGNEVPEKAMVTTKEKWLTETLHKELYYRRFCFYLLTRKLAFSGFRKHSNGIALEVENIVFDKEELYFVLRAKNTTTLDHDIDFLNFYVAIHKKGRRKSLQRLYQAPLYQHLLPKRIKKGKTTRMVYVLPKFSLSEDKFLLLRLNEDKGVRNIELKIPGRHINNPNWNGVKKLHPHVGCCFQVMQYRTLK